MVLFIECAVSTASLTDVTHQDKVKCHIPSSCNYVRCCVYIEPVKRHTEVELKMNTCTYEMVTAVGNQVAKAEKNLFNYAWGNSSFCTIFKNN